MTAALGDEAPGRADGRRARSAAWRRPTRSPRAVAFLASADAGYITGAVHPRRRRPGHGPLTVDDCAAVVGNIVRSQQGETLSGSRAVRPLPKCAVEVLSVDEDQVVPEAKFGDDLDADSLDLVELVMALEEEFDIKVPEEELEGIETVGQAYDLVVGKL